MPLPWLIGAAVVAAAAAVVKAVNADDSPSSYDSGDTERRDQEREARLQRKRDGLTAKVKNLKKDRLEEACTLLGLSAENLAQLPEKKVQLTSSKFERALRAKPQATPLHLYGLPALAAASAILQQAEQSELQANSEYAEKITFILRLTEHSRENISQQELDEFLVNLQMLESLYGPIPFGSEEQQDLAALREVGSRLDKLQTLKQQLEQQG